MITRVAAKIFVSVIILTIFFITSNKATNVNGTCYPTKQTFQEACTSEFNGVVDGSRCFFVTNLTGDWAQGWAQCRAMGSVMGQVHTSSEFNEIVTFFKNKSPIWISMRTDPNGDSAEDFLPLNTTYWFDNEISGDTKLSAENTWIRTRENDDSLAGGTDNCIAIWPARSGFRDASCATGLQTLCQISNPAQNFTLVPNVCMSEMPIDEFAVSNPDACASRCVQFGWCRSFNFMNGNLCQLFSWSVSDGPATVINAACQHYTYEP